ncbi:hypothetical protein C0389_00315 [bacterium]|nr:hypothetical protein [bacterium]
MEERKLYTIGEKKFTLRESFSLADWEESNRVDSFFGKIQAKEEENTLAQSVTKEEFIDFLDSVLVPVDGQKVEKAFFNNLNMQKAVEIFTDFFFIYLELNVNSAKHFRNLGQRLELSKEKLNS